MNGLVEEGAPFVVRCGGWTVRFVAHPICGNTFGLVADREATTFNNTEEARLACVKHGLRSIHAVIEPLNAQTKS